MFTWFYTDMTATHMLHRFLKIQSIGAKGEQVINYSDRFTISGMTGVFPANVVTGLKTVSGTDGPSSTAQEAPAAGAGGAEGQYAIPYAEQTGLIKYAPMLTPPGPKITAKKAKARYPTSSVSFAKTFLPTPKQTTTMTASQTASVIQSKPFQVNEEHILKSLVGYADLKQGPSCVLAYKRHAEVSQQVERLNVGRGSFCQTVQ